MKRIFSILHLIETSYGVYIGKKDLPHLAIFISGFECAIYELTGCRASFDSTFQRYVEHVVGKEHYSGRHWDMILQDNKTAEDAFDSFFVLLSDFEKVYEAFRVQ